MIPAEAVEAATKTLHEHSVDKLANSLPWEDLTPYQVSAFRGAANSILEAAAPYMLAAAWDEGEAAGQDNAYAYQVGIAVKSNPYRPSNAV